jgi:hypothetical protein
VYFSQDPVLAVGGGGGGGRGGGGGGGAQIPGVGMNVSPNSAATQKLSPWEPAAIAGMESPRGGAGAPLADVGGRGPSTGSGQAFAGGRGGGGFAAGADAPRVILRFPANADEMLLSGVLVGGEALAGRAQVVDSPIGTGHVVMFAIRPFWRFQTQGTFFLGFNAILNWNHLDAGK